MRQYLVEYINNQLLLIIQMQLCYNLIDVSICFRQKKGECYDNDKS